MSSCRECGGLRSLLDRRPRAVDWDFEKAVKILAAVGRLGRRSIRELVTILAPLRMQSSPVNSCERVGMHMGAT